jgi:hypothetical protein
MISSDEAGRQMVPDRKLDAAAFGFPGRTITVLRRVLRPWPPPWDSVYDLDIVETPW